MEPERWEEDEFQEEVVIEEPEKRSGVVTKTTIVVALVALVVGFLLGYLGRGQFGPEAQARRATEAAQVALQATRQAANRELMKYLVQNGRHFKGDENAPVTIIEFSDFQCPFCGRFARETKVQIEEAYVATGKVRFAYWNYAFLGDESTWAAEAAECAADQGRYWEYHDKLFNEQSGENEGGFSKENLKRFAVELGLDSVLFNECLDSGKYTELIQSDAMIAQQIGVRSTPSFLINGTPLVGAQPFSAFQQVIESLLKQSSQ